MQVSYSITLLKLLPLHQADNLAISARFFLSSKLQEKGFTCSIITSTLEPRQTPILTMLHISHQNWCSANKPRETRLCFRMHQIFACVFRELWPLINALCSGSLLCCLYLFIFSWGFWINRRKYFCPVQWNSCSKPCRTSCKKITKLNTSHFKNECTLPENYFHTLQNNHLSKNN